MNPLLDVTAEYQRYGLLAFIATVFATPLAIQVARRTGVMDYPDTFLKPHAKPTPYLGGTAICLGWALALSWAIAAGAVDWRLLLPILLGGLAISIIGLVDDVRDISPRVRLLGGALVIGAVVLTTGAGLKLVDSVFEPAGILFPRWIALPASFALSVVVVLGACHSTNLIDGLDGLCTGVTAIISFGFCVLAAYLAVCEYSQMGDPVRLVLAIAMLGAAMGFLPFNFKPAKIFMGDAGSTLLGFNCGMLILLFAERSVVRWVIAALMIFALPVFDTALAMFRRWRSGRSIFAGDRSHFYDQLVQRGLTVRQSVLVCYLLAVFFGAVGLLSILVRTRYTIIIYVGVCLATALVAWRTGLTHPEQRENGTNAG
ncbi:MAG: glycosyltransferase family 4 protein [Phycisphaerae bacterium]